MAPIHCDPDRLREFILETTATTARLRERWFSLLNSWLLEVSSRWNDETAQEAQQRLEMVTFRLRDCFDALDLGGQRLAAHAGRLDEYLSCHSRPHVPVPSLAGAPDRPVPLTARPGPTGATVKAKDGKALELWSFAGASPDDFDWGDAAFPATFETESHHGNTADVYRRWVRQAAGVVEQVQRRGWDAVGGDDARQVRDVFLGSEPPRIVLRGDGSKPVAESRHRVLAAVKQGVTIPVQVVRLPPPGLRQATALATCAACGGSRHCRACAGSGRTSPPDWSGSFEKMVAIERRPEIACPACGGTGECAQCSGPAPTTKQ